MSKAEDNAMQHCCTSCKNNNLNCGMKLISHGRDCIECSNYIEGYHQAEKDLEIMWKDIELIVNIDLDTNHEEVITGSRKNEEHYQEVLKRFKDFKERKDGGKG